MILIDFNGCVIGSIIHQKMDHSLSDIRISILNAMRAYNKKFRKQYGQLVICCEGRSWRKEFFKEYKASRKTTRDGSDLDWEFIFNSINTVVQEIRDNMPWIVIQHGRAEADDIIGALVESTQSFGKCEPVMIVSSDKDFLQLQKYSNVKQFSVKNQKQISTDDPRKFLDEQILRGDREDGVPNVWSLDNSFTDSIRQAPMRQKYIDDILSYDNIEDYPFPAGIRSHWERNKSMIDLSETPTEIVSEVIDKYEDATPAPRSKILNYFVAARCRTLMNCIEDFYPHG